MPPITWKNIAIPDFAKGQAILTGQGADSFTGAVDSVKGILTTAKTNIEKQWETGKQSNTSSLIGVISDTDDYNTLMGDRFKRKTLNAQFKDQYDPIAVNTAFQEQLDKAKTKLVGQGIEALGNEDLTSLQRREKLSDIYNEQGISKNEIPGLVNKAEATGAPQWAAIKQHKVKQNTDELLSQHWTPKTALVHLAQAKADGDYNMERLTGQAEAVSQEYIQKMTGGIQSLHQQGATVKDLRSFVQDFPDATPVMQLEAMNKLKDLYGPTANDREIAEIDDMQAALQASIPKEKFLNKYKIELAINQKKLTKFSIGEDINKIAVTSGIANGAADAEGLLQGIVTNQNTRLFMNDLDADDVMNTFNALKGTGIGPAAAYGIMLQVSKYPTMTDGRHFTYKNKAILLNKHAKQLGLEYQEWEKADTKVDALNSFIVNKETEFTRAEQSAAFKNRSGFLSNGADYQRTTAKYDYSTPFSTDPEKAKEKLQGQEEEIDIPNVAENKPINTPIPQQVPDDNIIGAAAKRIKNRKPYAAEAYFDKSTPDNIVESAVVKALTVGGSIPEVVGRKIAQDIKNIKTIGKWFLKDQPPGPQGMMADLEQRLKDKLVNINKKPTKTKEDEETKKFIAKVSAALAN